MLTYKPEKHGFFVSFLSFLAATRKEGASVRPAVLSFVQPTGGDLDLA